MVRWLTKTTLIGVLIGAIALVVFERRQAPDGTTAQVPAEFALPSASLRDLFP